VWILRSQGIEVLHAESPRIPGLRDARTGGQAGPEALAGPVWIVPLDQPAAPLVRAILDPHVPMGSEFLLEEREYLERGRGSRLYETTAWSLLLAFGIEAYWAPPLRRDPAWKETLIPGFEGRFVNRGDAVAWLVDGVPDRSAPLLADLLQQGISVKVADRPFTVDGRAWERGTLLIPREGNPADIEESLKAAAARWRAEVRATPTARAEEGPDLGGGHFHPLIEPRVGIWTGAPVSPSAYGALWRLLDEDVRLRFSGLDVSRFGQTDLGRYNVLVFPPVFGGAGVYRQLLGGEGLDRLKAWIQAGGTAIGIGGGAEFLADKEVGITRARLRRQALDRYPPVVIGPGPMQALEAGTFRAVGLRTPPDREPGESKEEGKKKGPEFRGESPYDVAPILGPGARPFAEGYDAGTPVEMLPVDLAEWLKPFLPPGKAKPDPEDLLTADERLRRFRPHGAFLRIELDPDVWLNWGLPAQMPALVRQRDALVAEPPVQVAARFADVERLHLGGLLWPEAAARLAHTAYVTREAKGRGQVILFLDSPEIRGWTLATRRLLLNAILFGPGAGTRWSRPW
jgi:hypothetical protein